MKNDIIEQQRIEKAPTTEVINIKFCYSCLSEEDLQFKDSLEEVHTYAELKKDPRASLPSTFSICFTAKRTYGTSQVFFVLLGKDRSTWLPLGLFIDENQVSRFHHWDPVGAEQPPVFPHQWVRSCLAINTESGLLRWVVDGTLVENSTVPQIKDKTNKPTDLTENIVVGVYQPPLSFQWMMIPNQVLTNMNIFSRALSIDEMIQNTKEQSCHIEGDFLAWNDMEWILHGQARKETIESEEMCEEKPLVDLFYTPFPGMDSCMRHCENLGTRAPSVTTLEDWTRLQTFLKRKLYDKGLNTLEIWLPITDRESEGVWKDFYTEHVIQNFTHPWMGSKPDGGEAESCVRLFDENNWGDRRCDYPNFACMCSHQSITLTLRGLCPTSVIDVHYKLMHQQTDIRGIGVQGLTHTSIEYEKKQKKWTLAVTGSNVTGTSMASFASFTLGKHNWTISGDGGCSSEDTYTTELKMSGCTEGNFSCDDGQCVSMDLRCNQFSECRDESDEMNCNILALKRGYNKKIPPIDSRSPDVDVSVSIDLLRLVDIDEEDYSIEIQFEITLVWKEKRATYQNLKKRDSLNSLSEKDIHSLWLPKVIYENTDQKETTRLGDRNWEWETRVLVRREQQKGTMRGPESVDETEIFEGSENSLVMNQTYTRTFQCNYQLSYYPFDTQVLLGIFCSTF